MYVVRKNHHGSRFMIESATEGYKSTENLLNDTKLAHRISKICKLDKFIASKQKNIPFYYKLQD